MITTEGRNTVTDKGTDPAPGIRRLRDSIRAKLTTRPRADHNGRYEVDDNATRYPSGLIDPPAGGDQA